MSLTGEKGIHYTPIGLCVEVDPWEETNQTRQSFARLRSGIAWIPRHIHNELFSYIIQTPEIRRGKFYFQVIYKRGMKVRQGPSRRAPSILSNNEPIRYECGEFLLISDIFTMFGPNDTSSSTSNHLSECFGKVSNTQWVHIHSNGRYYLQEQTHPPSVDKSTEGWRYDATTDHPIYNGPSYNAPHTKRLKAGESIMVYERMTMHLDKTTWLKTMDGLYVPDVSSEGELIMVADLKQDGGYDGVMPTF